MPKISGLWTPIRNEDGSVDNTPWEFHIKAKDKWREMFASDPEATGSSLSLLKELLFNESLAVRNPDEQPVLNEPFLDAMLADYDKSFKAYNPGLIERSIYPKASKFTMALIRNDSAYYERIMGIMGYLINSHTKFADLNGDHIEVLKSAHEWWKMYDQRDRTKGWIDWVFRFIINKYKTDSFYKKSVNHILYFMHLNADKWQVHESHLPANWFCNGRGAQVNILYAEKF